MFSTLVHVVADPQILGSLFPSLYRPSANKPKEEKCEKHSKRFVTKGKPDPHYALPSKVEQLPEDSPGDSAQSKEETLGMTGVSERNVDLRMQSNPYIAVFRGREHKARVVGQLDESPF